MKSRTEQIGETRIVSETTTHDENIFVENEPGDCIHCPQKSSATSGICPTFALYRWCEQTMGKKPKDLKEPSFYCDSLRWVDSTPNSEYPIRILRAYLDTSTIHTYPDDTLGDFMNELQDQRNKLLYKAISILGKHEKELGSVLGNRRNL